MNPTIETASVKVMRSYDYCHFEVSLSSSTANTPEAVDELRKTAAKLADKAVEQYTIAKRNAELDMQDANHIANMRYNVNHLLNTPEADRTPEDKAAIKAFEDMEHYKRTRYHYEDDWLEDHPWDNDGDD